MNQTKSLLWAIALLFTLLQSTPVYSQNRVSVKGIVADSTGLPLPGATISQEGNPKNGTITGPEGSFELNAPPGSRLKITMTGFRTAFAVAGTSQLSIILRPVATDLTDVIVVGYGTQKRAKMTSAVSSMNAEDIQLIPATNLSNVLAGRLSGTFVSSPTGTPGIGSNVKVRSRSSFSNSAVEPLYVIDGIVRDKTSFDALDPNEVADITILKDASSAAIYGSRSSNGAILVTTKTGKSGAAVINFNATYNTQRVGKLPEYMPVKDGLNLTKAVNGGLSDEEINWVLQNNPNGDNYYKAAYTNPSSQRYALSVSGGNEKIRGYIGGSYINED
ncbi:TonB-dependent receptor plug domain-containing protein, partial [Chitinophaga sp.]|uniref:TonB-dependent receptor plug domain-containing protein n=1 Tax=Chitinophaga sp. TaxID=1869181 RepID=UPI002CFD981E